MKRVVLFNTTCLAKLSHIWANFSRFTGKKLGFRFRILCHYILTEKILFIRTGSCNSYISPNMWYWSIPHVSQNIWNWTIPHVWRNFSCFTGKKSMVRLNICTHYWNVNPMTLKMLHWKIHTSSLEFKQSNTRPPALCWIVSTLVSRYGFFNVTFLKSLDYLNTSTLLFPVLHKTRQITMAKFTEIWYWDNRPSVGLFQLSWVGMDFSM